MFDPESRARACIRPEALALKAYAAQPAEVARVGEKATIKLDAMESPFSWPEEWRARLTAKLRMIEVNRYPDGGAANLLDALRSVYAISPEWGLLPGNGSDELIQLLCLAVAGPGRLVLLPAPSFSMYAQSAVAAGSAWLGVDLADDFSLDIRRMLEVIAERQPALIFIAQPNNPTGNLFDLDDIERVCSESQGLVVLDEAYMAYSDSDCLPLLARHDNLVLLRTLSKLGLAGARIGFLVAHSAWIKQLEKLRLPYNVSAFDQAVACFALERHDDLFAWAGQIIAFRARLAARLACLPGARLWPSATNFLLLRLEDAPQIHAALSRRGVLIKLLHGSHPLLEQCLRITVGDPEQNAALCAVLDELLAERTRSGD